MRILILGAGGVGGYYGARIHQAGGQVSFLVRPARAAQLRASGLNVYSPFGDLHIVPNVLTQDALRETFDVILLSCKAYDLASAVDALAPALGEGSVIVPFLNGIGHIDRLVERFGADRVLGGVAFISATLAPNGDVQHLNPPHRLVIGSLVPSESRWLRPLATLLAQSGFDFELSADVEQVMWDKLVFLATLAGSTCLWRASIGDVLATLAGESFVVGLFDECNRIAETCGHKLTDAQREARFAPLGEKGSPLMASMLRDIERGKPTEAEHILGDLVRRAEEKAVAAPRLRLAYSHLQAYERRRF